jgi:hypothetical protein
MVTARLITARRRRAVIAALRPSFKSAYTMTRDRRAGNSDNQAQGGTGDRQGGRK